jgi:hypothetical protein
MSSTYFVTDEFVSAEALEQRFDFKATTWERWAREGKVRSLLGSISLTDAERLYQDKDGQSWQPTRCFPPSGGQR